MSQTAEEKRRLKELQKEQRMENKVTGLFIALGCLAAIILWPVTLFCAAVFWLFASQESKQKVINWIKSIIIELLKLIGAIILGGVIIVGYIYACGTTYEYFNNGWICAALMVPLFIILWKYTPMKYGLIIPILFIRFNGIDFDSDGIFGGADMAGGFSTDLPNTLGNSIGLDPSAVGANIDTSSLIGTAAAVGGINSPMFSANDLNIGQSSIPDPTTAFGSGLDPTGANSLINSNMADVTFNSSDIGLNDLSNVGQGLIPDQSSISNTSGIDKLLNQSVISANIGLDQGSNYTINDNLGLPILHVDSNGSIQDNMYMPVGEIDQSGSNVVIKDDLGMATAYYNPSSGNIMDSQFMSEGHIADATTDQKIYDQTSQLLGTIDKSGNIYNELYQPVGSIKKG